MGSYSGNPGVHHVTVSIQTQDGTDSNTRKSAVSVTTSGKDLNTAIKRAVSILELHIEPED